MIIAYKVHFFTILQVLKVFKPDFCQTLDLRSQTCGFHTHIPLYLPHNKFELFNVGSF